MLEYSRTEAPVSLSFLHYMGSCCIGMVWWKNRFDPTATSCKRVGEFGLCHLAGESASLDCPPHDSKTDTEDVAFNCLSYFLLGCLPIFSFIFAFTSSNFEWVVVCCKRVVRPSITLKMYLSASCGSRKADSDSQRMPLVSEYQNTKTYQGINEGIFVKGCVLHDHI